MGNITMVKSMFYTSELTSVFFGTDFCFYLAYTNKFYSNLASFPLLSALLAVAKDMQHEK